MAEPTPGDSNSPDSSSTQTKREMRIATPLGTDAVLLTEWSGYEAISELFCFQATLICDPKQPLDFDKLLGQNVTITLEQGNQTTRCFNGMVRQLGQGRRDDSYLHYDAEIVPQLWLTTQNLQSRIFQQMSVPDILRQVLADYNVSYELSGTYEPRNYCVQYRESDFDFVNRLMEEEGIYYFFQHSSSAHQLIIVDNMLSLPTIGSSSTIIYDELQGGLRDESRITRWEKRQQLCAQSHPVGSLLRTPGTKPRSLGRAQTIRPGRQNQSLAQQGPPAARNLRISRRIRQTV